MVSIVVKVLLAIRNSVLSGCSCFEHAASSWPSTLLTKCRRLPVVAKASSASTAICGPRSEPPMPMLTTSVMAASARTASAKASIASSVACTSARSAASGTVLSATRRAQQGVQHGPAFGGVDGLAGEHRIAVGFDAGIRAPAPAASCCVSASIRFFDRSANTCGAVWLNTFETPGVFGEGLAQVEVAAALLVAGVELAPGGCQVATGAVHPVGEVGGHAAIINRRGPPTRRGRPA